MACGCRGGAGTGAVAPGALLGYYVTREQEDGTVIRTPNVNVEDPNSGEAPFLSEVQARQEVTLYGRGTIRALRRPKAS